MGSYFRRLLRWFRRRRGLRRIETPLLERIPRQICGSPTYSFTSITLGGMTTGKQRATERIALPSDGTIVYSVNTYAFIGDGKRKQKR